jgi:hypothetical protein
MMARRLAVIAGRLLVVLLVTITLLEGALRAGFVWLPAPVQLHLIEHLPPPDLPGNIGETAWALREFPSQLAVNRAATVNYRAASDNDLYQLTCARPPADLNISHRVQYDALGFRADQTHPLTADNPDVIVLADSFGASVVMGSPFWQGVSRRVWGLAVDAAGLVEQANTLRAVLGTRNVAPDVIVVTYFEGNDLAEDYNAATTATPFTAEEPPAPPSLLARLYSVQVARFMIARVIPPADIPLPSEAARDFAMFVDTIPPTLEPFPIYAGTPLRGWAFDSRAGQTTDNGIVAVRLHAGNTCQDPVRAVDAEPNQRRNLRQDVVDVFNFPPGSPYRYSGFWLPLDLEPGVQAITICAESAVGNVVSETRAVDVAPCPFPTQTQTGQDIVFYSLYMNWMTLDADVIAASESYRHTTGAILEVQAMADALGAELVLLYVPTKVHTYINAVGDDTLLAYGDQLQAYDLVTNRPGWEFGPIADRTPPDVVDRLRENVGDQRDVIAAFAAANDIVFVDATPALQAAVAAGDTPYYPADTHTNDFGAGVIRELLREALVPYLKEAR